MRNKPNRNTSVLPSSTQRVYKQGEGTLWVSEIKTAKVSPLYDGGTVELPGGGGGGGGGAPSAQVFTSSGTWTKPEGVTKIQVTVVGGGGGGGRAFVTELGLGGLGGQAGGQAIKYAHDVSAITSAAITVGEAGSAGTYLDNDDGMGSPSDGQSQEGGTSSYSDGSLTITCPGGRRGDLTDDFGGDVSDQVSNGVPTGGDINIEGQLGQMSNFNRFCGGPGGSGILGSGGGGIMLNEGKPGTGYGAGGSASANPAGTEAQRSGGAGSQGVVIILEYR
jgi:hypothetical protein